jgi:hypothetical protein
MKKPPDVDAAFAKVADALAGKSVDQVRSRFGTPNLRVGGKVFAMAFKQHLVVKLPAARVAALIEAGTGEPFVMGKRVMKEWVQLAPGRGDWTKLAREARDFVAAG